MAHFAKLDANNIVIEVNVVDNDKLLDANNIEREEIGVAFLVQWSGGYTNWKQTSYNNKFRKNYAGIGCSYDSERDAFIPPKFCNSWVLNETTCQWEAPVPYPNDEKFYTWNDNKGEWEETVLPS
jgi:hypothetical protein